jgi:hypothetical protein
MHRAATAIRPIIRPAAVEWFIQGMALTVIIITTVKPSVCSTDWMLSPIEWKRNSTASLED